METEKTLVLEFWDEDNRTKSLVIKNPKEDLTKEDVEAAMRTIIDENVLLTNSGNFSVKASYTEPLGNNFYASGVYSYEWKKTVSDKDFYNFEKIF